jgi:hypothetical protein
LPSQAPLGGSSGALMVRLVEIRRAPTRTKNGGYRHDHQPA